MSGREEDPMISEESGVPLIPSRGRGYAIIRIFLHFASVEEAWLYSGAKTIPTNGCSQTPCPTPASAIPRARVPRSHTYRADKGGHSV